MNILNPKFPHSIQEAKEIQTELQSKICLEKKFNNIETITGIDVSYDLKNNFAFAFLVTLNFATLTIVETSHAKLPINFPYVPGFLSFREIPVILKAIGKLKKFPELLMVDGHGIAHPRSMGIASHLGVILNLPSLGVAKKKLVGYYQEPALEKGSNSKLIYKDQLIGTVLRSKDKINPIFISPGHFIDHQTATQITINCLKNYKLPEPTRIADKLSKENKY